MPSCLHLGLFGERARTAAVLAVAATVAVLAASDALRGGSSPPSADPAAGLPAPPAGALAGSLWYSDTECRLHRIDLRSMRDATVTRTGGHCRFWISPDRRLVAMHPGRPFTRPPDMEILDLRTGEITTPFHRHDLAFSPPAWSPDSHTLVVCDGTHGPPSLRAYDVADGRITTPASNACYPSYVRGRLAYRDLDSLTWVGRREIAGDGRLGDILHGGVYQAPGPAAADGVLAIPATTVTPAGGPPPITTVVLFNAAGHVIGRWDTGAVADTAAVLGGGRVLAVSRRSGLVLEDRLTGRLVTSAAGRPIVAAAAAPGGQALALSDGGRIVVADLRGRARFAIPERTRWLQWTR
jgi:hypothetical protein